MPIFFESIENDQVWKSIPSINLKEEFTKRWHKTQQS